MNFKSIKFILKVTELEILANFIQLQSLFFFFLCILIKKLDIFFNGLSGRIILQYQWAVWQAYLKISKSLFFNYYQNIYNALSCTNVPKDIFFFNLNLFFIQQPTCLWAKTVNHNPSTVGPSDQLPDTQIPWSQILND